MRFGFFRNRDGAAAVEFGLVAPIVVAVLVGVATMGGKILAYNKMRQAVSSGAQYALSVEDDAEAIEDVVYAAWPHTPASAEVDVAQACYCADAPTVATDCSITCADGDYPQQFTTITANMSYAGLAGGTQEIEAQQRVRTR